MHTSVEYTSPIIGRLVSHHISWIDITYPEATQGTHRMDGMLTYVCTTTKETQVNIPPNLDLQLADRLISLGRLCT